MIREVASIEVWGVANLLFEALTQITQRTNAPAVARPARWRASGRAPSRVLPRPARPFRPHPSDELEFSQYFTEPERSASSPSYVNLS
jgi:hypothetical protein